MIIYGWGKTTDKIVGEYPPSQCPNQNCGAWIGRQLIKRRTWFTLFWIPLIPYKTEYILMCPNCKVGSLLDKAQFNELAQALKNINM